MMNRLEAAARLALEALIKATPVKAKDPQMQADAIVALREALAEQAAEQAAEPVTLETVYETIIKWDEGGGKRSRRELARRIVALYAAPTQQPLTEEQIGEIGRNHEKFDKAGNEWFDRWAFARAIEAAHGITSKKGGAA